LPPEASLTVVGSVNLDLVARSERLPRVGETLTDAAFARFPGGKGANQAVASARLDADVRFVGCVGRDDFARDVLDAMRADGVEADVVESDEPTGVALIVVDAAGENTIVVAPGANSRLRAGDVDVGSADAVLSQLEIPLEAVEAAAERATGLFALNAAPARELPAWLLQRGDLLVVNRAEAEALDLAAPRGLVAVTLGAEGAMLLEGGEELARAPAPAVDAVDATAAGDAFCAALLVSLLEGRDRREALRRACAAGALTASRPGAQPSLPTTAELGAMM
jgi:ribokinase